MVFQERAAHFVPQQDLDHALDLSTALPLVQHAAMPDMPAAVAPLPDSFSPPNHAAVKLKGLFSDSHVHFASSWSEALFAALMALGIETGDEVIIPALAPLSVVQAVLVAGAQPVFADVTPDLPLVGDETIKAAISNKTKLVIVSHLGGFVRDCGALADWLSARNISLLAEASDAFTALAHAPQALDQVDLLLTCLEDPASNHTCLPAILITRDDHLDTQFQGWAAAQSPLFRDDWPCEERHCINLLGQLDDATDQLLNQEIDAHLDASGQRDKQVRRYQTQLGDKAVRFPKLEACLGYSFKAFPLGLTPEVREACLAGLQEMGFRPVAFTSFGEALRIYPDRFKADRCQNACIWIDETIGLPTGSLLGEREQTLLINSIRNYL